MTPTTLRGRRCPLFAGCSPSSSSPSTSSCRRQTTMRMASSTQRQTRYLQKVLEVATLYGVMDNLNRPGSTFQNPHWDYPNWDSGWLVIDVPLSDVRPGGGPIEIWPGTSLRGTIRPLCTRSKYCESGRRSPGSTQSASPRSCPSPSSGHRRCCTRRSATWWSATPPLGTGELPTRSLARGTCSPSSSGGGGSTR